VIGRLYCEEASPASESGGDPRRRHARGGRIGFTPAHEEQECLLEAGWHGVQLAPDPMRPQPSARVLCCGHLLVQRTEHRHLPVPKNQ
jgi:hypothetical protein